VSGKAIAQWHRAIGSEPSGDDPRIFPQP